MNRSERRILQRRERKIMKRLARRTWDDQPRPMFRARNIQYEMAERVQASDPAGSDDCGGLGAIHALAHSTGLIRRIDKRLHLLKRHLPYHESDHVLNVAYNVVTGGECLDDLERRRNDEGYLDALGAQRIPDPATEGDFTRRFTESDVAALMEVVNGIQPRLWRKRLSREERARGGDRRGRHARPNDGRMQGRHGPVVQRHWGLQSAGRVAGQHL